MMIVISLMTILSTIALIGYRSAVTRSREAVLKEDLFRMRDAIDQYYADTGEYPSGLDALVSNSYLRAVPQDPFTNSPNTWQTILTDFDPENPFSQGIYDVKSGYEGLSLDGTPYAHW